jgi:hypothetical protein
MINKKDLKNIFVARSNGLEGVCFPSEVMNEDNPRYPIYRAISSAQHDSGLSFNFSYEVASKAVDILTEVNWDDEDAITEAIDSAIPVYTHELMSIYNDNAWIVDEAVQDLGDGDSEDSAKRAQMGWYRAIGDMVQSIKNNLTD